MLSTKKFSHFGNPCVIIIFTFLLQSATPRIIQHQSTTLKNHQNATIQSHNFNDTTPSQAIHLSQPVKQDIQKVKTLIDDLTKSLQPGYIPLHRQKRSGPQAPNSTTKLTMIETQISTLNQKLASLLRTSSLNTEDRKRIGELETSVNNLQTSINNQRPDLMQEIDKKINEKLEKLTQSVNSLNLRLDNLEIKIDQEAKSRLPAEIVQDLKSYRFSTAENKLIGKDDNTYYYVVHEVYNHQAGNFDLLLNFGDSIQDMERKFKIYDSLYKETVSSGLKDPHKLLRLSQSIRIGILIRSTGAIAAQNLYLTLMNVIQEAAVEPIYSAFRNDNSWSTVKQLSADINDLCPECTLKIFNSMIETIWNKITIDDLLSRSRQHLKYISEDMALHMAVMEKLKRTGALNTASVIPLARYMKLTMDDSNYKNVHSDKRSKYEDAKNKIPESVKNLAFSSAICIKNTRYNEYLFAGASPDYVYDDDRRHVFTWTPGNRDEPSKFKWYVTFRDSQEIILRNDYFNEYLYAAKNTYDDTRRYAFTWRPGSPVLNGIWQVEVDGDSIQLFNTEHKEYLFADYDEIKHETRRYVFTYRRGTKTSDSKWQIVDCSNFN